LRFGRIALFLLSAVAGWGQPHHAYDNSPAKRVVIAATTVLDGKGHVLKNTRIVIEGSRIIAIDPHASPVDYDLRGLTVLLGRSETARTGGAREE